jgi:SAGA-associated factor 29
LGPDSSYGEKSRRACATYIRKGNSTESSYGCWEKYVLCVDLIHSGIKMLHDLTRTELSIAEIDELDKLYRENVNIVEKLKSLLGTDTGSGTIQNLGILKALVDNNENTREDVTVSRGSTSRDSHSRSAVDPYDGPSGSPGPSPAENRQIRKLGGGNPRNGSQPPRSGVEVIINGPSEPSERNANKPKIVYAKDDEVVFKRKMGDDSDWIQGIVTRVIGEGKSRRYEVRDPYPDDAGKSEVIYKSSASQMVPIPGKDAKLEDYEVGKRVLALYPGTSTFYRADVKQMVDGELGREVLLLFEEETENQMEKRVARQFVLDHKG